MDHQGRILHSRIQRQTDSFTVFTDIDGALPSRLQTTLQWAEKLHNLAPLDRYSQLNGALRSLEDLLEGVSSDELKSSKSTSALINVTALVAEWMRYKPRSFSAKHAARYRQLEHLIRNFSRRVPSQPASRLLRYSNAGQPSNCLSRGLI